MIIIERYLEAKKIVQEYESKHLNELHKPKLNISAVISSLTLEDITKIVNAFNDINIPIEAVKEEIELNYLYSLM